MRQGSRLSSSLRRDQQGFLFARELTACSGARHFAERRPQVAEYEALLGPVDSRAANAHADRDVVIAGARVGGQQNLRPFEPARCVLDRKSTRLNSSHLGISYAVFCLK